MKVVDAYSLYALWGKKKTTQQKKQKLCPIQIPEEKFCLRKIPIAIQIKFPAYCAAG